MKDRLSKHIEKILLREKYCTLPSFGAFVKEDISAHIDYKKSLIMPPSYEILFNESLKYDDAMLQQSYAQSYAISLRKARVMLDSDIRELRTALLENKNVEFGKIGSLTLNNNGSISFIPNKQDLKERLIYGLSPISLLELNSQKESLINKNDKSNYLYFKIHKATAASATFILVIMIALMPLLGIKMDKKDVYTAGISSQIIQKNNNEDAEMISNNDAKITNEIIEENGFIYKSESELDKYNIVIAADNDIDRLNRYYEHLREKGVVDKVQILKKGKMAKMILLSLEDKEEAEKRLLELRKENKAFEMAWIYKNSK